METVGSREYLAGKAFPRDILFCQTVLSDTHFLHRHYIYPHYPQMMRRASERKTQQKHLRVRNCYTNNSLHICLWNFVISYLSISVPLRGWQHKHLLHPLRVLSEVFGTARKHWKKSRMADATWSSLWDPKCQIGHSSEKPCWSRSFEGLVIEGRLCLEGLLFTHVSQLIFQWIDYHLEGGGEVFRRVLRFPLQ